MDKPHVGSNGSFGTFLVYEQVDAEIEIVQGDLSDDAEAEDFELENVVFAEPGSPDPNDNPKYSQKIKNKAGFLKCEENAHFEATKVRA